MSELELNEDNTEVTVEEAVEIVELPEAPVEDVVEPALETAEEVAPAIDDVVEQIADLEVENTVISSPDTSKRPKSGPSIVAAKDEAIGSSAAARPARPAKPAKVEEKVAVFAEKNAYLASVGHIYRGYNIFTKTVADKWLTRSFVRLATPEEVAREFGN